MDAPPSRFGGSTFGRPLAPAFDVEGDGSTTSSSFARDGHPAQFAARARGFLSRVMGASGRPADPGTSFTFSERGSPGAELAVRHLEWLPLFGPERRSPFLPLVELWLRGVWPILLRRIAARGLVAVLVCAAVPVALLLRAWTDRRPRCAMRARR